MLDRDTETRERPAEPAGSDSWNSFAAGSSGAALGKSNPAAAHDQPLDIEELYANRRGTSGSWKGRRIGPYRLQRLLGSGNMAVVLQAEDVNLGRTVAIKLLRQKVKHLSRTEQVEQFFREAMCAASLDHPNIVQIHGFHEYQGHWLLVLEHLEGGSLGQAMERNGPLSPRRASLFLADAAAGVAEAHAAGIVHRDIKPSNLLLTRTGRCKVVDFGLALPSIMGDDFRLSAGPVGTPHYLAPEVLQMRPATAACDVYSLAATLYAVMTGRPPFPTDNRKEFLRIVLESPAPDVREIVPHASPALAELIEQGLAKKPYQRMSADEMASALRTEIASSSDVAGPTRPNARPATPIDVHPPTEILSAPTDIAPQRPAPAPAPAATKKPVVYWRGVRVSRP